MSRARCESRELLSQSTLPHVLPSRLKCHHWRGIPPGTEGLPCLARRWPVWWTNSLVLQGQRQSEVQAWETPEAPAALPPSCPRAPCSLKIETSSSPCPPPLGRDRGKPGGMRSLCRVRVGGQPRSIGEAQGLRASVLRAVSRGSLAGAVIALWQCHAGPPRPPRLHSHQRGTHHRLPRATVSCPDPECSVPPRAIPGGC